MPPSTASLSCASRKGSRQRSAYSCGKRLERPGARCSTTTTAARQLAGKARSKTPNASTPPAEAPMAIRRKPLGGAAIVVEGKVAGIASCPLKDFFSGSQFAEAGGMAAEMQAFLHAQAQEAPVDQRFMEQAQRAVLQVLVKVNHDIAAGNHMHLGKDAIRCQAVVGKHKLTPQTPVENGDLVGSGVIVRQGTLAARLPVILAELGDA